MLSDPGFVDCNLERPFLAYTENKSVEHTLPTWRGLVQDYESSHPNLSPEPGSLD